VSPSSASRIALLSLFLFWGTSSAADDATLATLRGLAAEPPDPARDRAAEETFRSALVEGVGGGEAVALFGRWLFVRHRPEESRPFLAKGCLLTRDERTCSASASVELALGEWDLARDSAQAYLDSPCGVFSERLWVARLVADDPSRAVTAAEGLLREQADREMSHLLLASALYRAGRESEGRALLAKARRALPRAFVLDKVRWDSVARAPKRTADAPPSESRDHPTNR
jgi:hypothetical protein